MKLTKSVQYLVLTTIIALGAAYTSYGQTVSGLHHFQSEVQGNTVAFDWSVAEDELVQTFEIERAGTDFLFETIGTIEARAPQASVTYRFTDQQPLPGVAFYRLKIIDQAGNVYYCKVLSQKVNELAQASR